jgi:hypothetical protein
VVDDPGQAHPAAFEEGGDGRGGGEGLEGGSGEPGHFAAGQGAGEAALPSTALPPRIESWRRRSAAGAILTGFAFGLKEALDPRREEPGIVMETSGDPPGDLPVEAEVGQIRASDNVVTIRPWLLGTDDEEPPTS